MWIVPHHFCGSFSCYGVRVYSLGGVGFNSCLLYSMFDPSHPQNHFISLGPPIGVKFASLRRIRVTGRVGKGIKATCFPHRFSATYVKFLIFQ